MATDTYLSEIHLGTPPGRGVCRTLFTFSKPVGADVSEEEDSDCSDEEINRRPHLRVEIEHALQTLLEDVGQQVWKGALLLADWVVANSERLASAVVLELGAGVGLTGIVVGRAVRSCKRVYVTDHRRSVVATAEKNIRLNGLEAKVRARVLDWAEPWPPEDESRQGWQEEDLHELRDCRVILAADVVYDDSSTAALVTALQRIAAWSAEARQGGDDRPVLMLVALEKRYIFTVHELRATAPAYDCFVRHIAPEADPADDNQAAEAGTARAVLRGRRLSVHEVPQACQMYSRGADLELWQLSLPGGRTDGREGVGAAAGRDAA